jgi:hypothetical protein
MRKLVLAFAFLLITAAGCSPRGPSDADMATRVAQILTTFPTSTPNPVLNPTLPPVATSPVQPPTTAPTVTEQPTATLPPTEPPLPSETPVPSLTPLPSATPTITATATPTAVVTLVPGDPVGRLGPATSTDPMDSPDTWLWPLGASEFTDMQFKNGAMLVTALKDVSGWRLEASRTLDNFYMEMAARLEKCSGSDSYGIIYRVPSLKEADQGYLFGFTCDGRYYLKSWDGKVQPEGQMTTLIRPTTSSAIQPGALVFNRLGVMAIGSRMILYANGVLLTEINDSKYSKGYWGVFINQDNTPNMVLRVDQMSYWENPKP